MGINEDIDKVFFFTVLCNAIGNDIRVFDAIVIIYPPIPNPIPYQCNLINILFG